MSNQPLFTPYRMGDLDLPNRIVMAPLTRMRAQPHDHVPTALQAEYYAQRASAGLIIAEATAIIRKDLAGPIHQAPNTQFGSWMPTTFRICCSWAIPPTSPVRHLKNW